MIVIVDYGIGNLNSVLNMLKKAGVKDVQVSNNIDVIYSATKLILPGVGAFDTGMKNLEESNFIPLLNKKVLVEKTPILGICLGMQLLSNKSEEGLKSGLGWIDADTIKFVIPAESKLKIPNMGWSYINVVKENPLVSKSERSRFYFVHSYHVKCNNPENVIATSSFGSDFTCMVNKENIYGAQFHPEKSLNYGMKLLEKFAKI